MFKGGFWFYRYFWVDSVRFVHPLSSNGLMNYTVCYINNYRKASTWSCTLSRMASTTSFGPKPKSHCANCWPHKHPLNSGKSKHFWDINLIYSFIHADQAHLWWERGKSALFRGNEAFRSSDSSFFNSFIGSTADPLRVAQIWWCLRCRLVGRHSQLHAFRSSHSSRDSTGIVEMFGLLTNFKQPAQWPAQPTRQRSKRRTAEQN